MGKENVHEKALFLCPVCFVPFSARALHEHIAEHHLNFRCLQIAYCPRTECKKKRHIFSVPFLTEHMCHKTSNVACTLIFQQKACVHRANCQILLDELMNFSLQELGPIKKDGNTMYSDKLQKDRIERCRHRAPYQHLLQENKTPACFVKDYKISTANGNSGHGLGRGSSNNIGRSSGFGGGGRSPGYGGGDRSPGYGDGGRSPGYGVGSRSPGYGDGGRSPGYGGGDRSPGYGGRDRSPGYGDGGRSPGYGRGGRSPGYGDGGRSPGYGRGDRSPGYGGGDRSPGYGGGDRSPGYRGGDRSPGYGDGGRSPGYGGGGRSPGYSGGGRSPGYGDGGRSPGYGDGDRSPGYGDGGRSPGYSGGDRSRGYGGGVRNDGRSISRCRSPGYIEKDRRTSDARYTQTNSSQPQDNEASTLAGSSNIISRSTVPRSQNSQERSGFALKNELKDAPPAVEINVKNHSRQNMGSKASAPLTSMAPVDSSPSHTVPPPSHSSHNFPSASNPPHSILNGYNPRISGSYSGNSSGQVGPSFLNQPDPIPWHTGSSYSGVLYNGGSNNSLTSPRRDSMDSLLRDTRDSECPGAKKKRLNNEPNQRH